MLIERLTPVREGEPDGAAGVQPDPSPPADPGLGPDPAPAEPVDGGPDDAADDAGEQEIAEELDVDIETARTLFRAYGKRFKETPEYQEEVRRIEQSVADRTRAELETAPERDEEFTAAQQQTRQAWDGLASRLRKHEDAIKRLADSGEDTAELAQASAIAEDAYVYATGVAFTKDRQHFAETDGALQRVIAEQRIELPAGHEAHKLYDEALQVYDRMRKSGDVKARDAAFRTYTYKSAQALLAAGIEQGRQLERKQIAQQQKDREATVNDNKVTEAIARATRRTAPAGPDAKPRAKPALTADTLLKGDWRQTQKLMQEAGHTI